MAVVGCMWPLVAVVDILLRSLFISFGFAAFMHTYNPLSMTPPSFLLLRTPSTPTLTPTRLTSFSTSLSSLVAFIFFSCCSGHCWHPLFFFKPNPYVIFYYTNNIHYMLIHPTLQRHDGVLLHSSPVHSYAAHQL